MTDRDALLQLRDRLAAATGPSWELDVALECALCGARTLGPEYYQTSRDTYRCVKGTTLYNPPNYTASIDDAITLVPPDSNWVLAVHSDEGIAATFITPDGTSAAEFGSSPALALCLARIEYEIARVPA